MNLARKMIGEREKLFSYELVEYIELNMRLVLCHSLCDFGKSVKDIMKKLIRHVIVEQQDFVQYEDVMHADLID